MTVKLKCPKKEQLQPLDSLKIAERLQGQPSSDLLMQSV